VDNFVANDGIIRTLYIKCFNELKTKYPDWAHADPMTVQAHYFASKTRKTGEVEFQESTGRSKEDETAFDLIMRAKEKLLSFDEPVAFIFSHSALREGWDNPNVFQICTMREVGSETERRQQVGRGIRLPVDQTGERIREETVNVLTVVASESYQRFVEGLQSEIEREYGKEGVPPPPPDKRKRTALDNPHEFATIAVSVIKAKLADQLVDGIKYKKIDEWYDQTLFDQDEIIDAWRDYIVPSEEISGTGGTHLWDGVPFESETEKAFAQDLEKRNDVKLYIKLPRWFEVTTPIGNYNPDWAIVMADPKNGEDRLYLVRETKSTLDLNQLRPDEKRKILCGRSHFRGALQVDYKLVTEASQLPDGGV